MVGETGVGERRVRTKRGGRLRHLFVDAAWALVIVRLLTALAPT
jgi:hypothetical protein